MKKILQHTRLELAKKFRRRLPLVVAKAKAWNPKQSDLRGQLYVFKGRLGRTNMSSSIFANQTQRFIFRVRSREAGFLSTAHLDVLWRTLRRKTRRFSVNFRRTSTVLQLYPIATKTQNQRPKGGRMGSGKSPLLGRTCPITAGQVLLECRELRNFPYQSFLEVRSAAKKLPLRCSVELLKYAF